jgi:transglutaminase-like putative cysteine protease
METVRAIYWYVKRHLTFCSDESLLAAQFGLGPDKELLISPLVLLQMPTPMGDCDDYSLLLASLLKALLVPVKFVSVAVDEAEPWRFSHVYVKAMVDGGWLALDASHGSYPGWEYGGKVFKQVEVGV